MAKKQMLYTQEGYNELVNELDYLKNTRREEIKDDLATARSFGDLSENAEYDEARNEQAKVEARIKELEEMIINAVIVDESKVDSTLISVGSIVKLYDEDLKEDLEYQIVGSNEANPMLGKISDLSPIGKALVGSREGDSLTIDVPGGVVHLKVGEVTRAHNNN